MNQEASKYKSVQEVIADGRKAFGKKITFHQKPIKKNIGFINGMKEIDVYHY